MGQKAPSTPAFQTNPAGPAESEESPESTHPPENLPVAFPSFQKRLPDGLSGPEKPGADLRPRTASLPASLSAREGKQGRLAKLQEHAVRPIPGRKFLEMTKKNPSKLGNVIKRSLMN